jgi:hypothetical protein
VSGVRQVVQVTPSSAAPHSEQNFPAEVAPHEGQTAPEVEDFDMRAR